MGFALLGHAAVLALVTSGGRAGEPPIVDGVAQIKIRKDEVALYAAAERFLGKKPEEIARIALETVQGHLRAILGTLTVAVYKSYGFVPEPVFIWTTGNNGLLGSLLALLFFAMGLGGWWLDRDAWHKQAWIQRQAGRRGRP